MTDTIEHQGVIISIVEKTAKVKIIQTSACAACHVKEICSASDTTEKVIDARILNDDFSVGEHVMVIGQKSIALQAVLLAYIVPFFVLFATLIILNLFIDNELIVGTCALCALIPYIIILRMIRSKIQAKFQFYVTKL